MEEKIVTGTPPMAFLPARNYKFKVSEENYVINIPRRGSYKDLAPNLFDEEDGEFNIYDIDSDILYTPAITKVLFAAGKYPNLKMDEIFVPYSIRFTDNEVIIIGNVAKIFLTK